MKYIDVLIPAIAGLLFFFSPDSFLKKDNPSYFEKKATLKKIGTVLIFVAFVYFGIKFYMPNN